MTKFKMNKDSLILPEIFPCDLDVLKVHPNSNFSETMKALEEGKQFVMEGTYGSALSFYTWIKTNIASKHRDRDYKSGRTYRDKLQKITSKLLVKVADYKVELRGAPDNYLIKEFYNGHDCFLISLPDFLGMNGAYQWYQKGIKFPGLKRKIYPYYGVYFPTRFDHLELFDNWLTENKDKFKEAADIGTGCGVLAFYMAKHGIESVDATDINPNAIISLEKDLKRINPAPNINPVMGEFFAGSVKQYDLIVFNPPWLPGISNSLIDKGVYYSDDLLEKFFEEAEKYLKPGGRIVLLFSNFAQLAGMTDQHPVETILNKSASFSVVNVGKQKVAQGKSKKNKHWMSTVREKEWVELWEIKFSN